MAKLDGDIFLPSVISDQSKTQASLRETINARNALWRDATKGKRVP